jgi:putative redox protein
VKATARRREGYAHDVEVDTGHTVLLDEPVSEGGKDEGPSPSRMLAASLAACTAITVEMYADRKGWDLGEVEVEVDYDVRPKEGPARFDVALKLPAALTDEQVERLLAIAHKCPVHRALTSQVVVEDRVVRAAAAPPT